MKIAFCIVTNRPAKMLRMAKTWHNGVAPGADWVFCYALNVGSFDKVERALIRLLSSPHGEVRIDECPTRFDKDGRFHLAAARDYCFKMAHDCDWIIVADDDFRFTPGTELYPWKAGERYIQAAQYMEANKDCGSIYMKGYLGGAKAANQINVMPSGYYETGMGIMLRGHEHRDYPSLITPEFMRYGTGSDAVVGLVAFLNGYYPAKTLNMAVNKDPSKKVEVPKGKCTTNLNALYATSPIRDYINLRYGEYRIGKPFPKQAIEIYNAQAYIKNFRNIFERKA